MSVMVIFSLGFSTVLVSEKSKTIFFPKNTIIFVILKDLSIFF